MRYVALLPRWVRELHCQPKYNDISLNPFEAVWILYRVELRGMVLLFTCLLAIGNYSRWCSPCLQILNCQWYNEDYLFWSISWEWVTVAVPRVRGATNRVWMFCRRGLSLSAAGDRFPDCPALMKAIVNRSSTRTYAKKRSLRFCAVERGILTGKEQQSRSGNK